MELTYARWLSGCTRAALTVLAAAFVAYLSGLLEPLMPLGHLPHVWSLPLERYLAATGAPTGWQWLRVATKGDYANLAGIAMLALVTLVCYLRLLAALIGRREGALAVMAALQVVLLVAAAAGLFTGGH